MITITSDIVIDEKEIKMDFIRASGPGGQNVNKVATAVQLRFDVRQSPSLPNDVRERLIARAGKKITDEGILIIRAERYRTQAQNREDAMERLTEMIRAAAKKPKTRRKTKPSAGSKRRRVEAKRRRSSIKRMRGPIQSDD